MINQHKIKGTSTCAVYTVGHFCKDCPRWKERDRYCHSTACAKSWNLIEINEATRAYMSTSGYKDWLRIIDVYLRDCKINLEEGGDK